MGAKHAESRWPFSSIMDITAVGNKHWKKSSQCRERKGAWMDAWQSDSVWCAGYEDIIYTPYSAEGHKTLLLRTAFKNIGSHYGRVWSDEEEKQGYKYLASWIYPMTRRRTRAGQASLVMCHSRDLLWEPLLAIYWKKQNIVIVWHGNLCYTPSMGKS